MSKSRFLILFVAIVVLALSGCSSDGGSGTTDPDGDVPVVDGDTSDGDVSDGDTETDGDTDQETADPCNPNPCEDANKTTCADDGEGNAVCSCDDGFEDYGDGACKPSDPCSTDTACAGENRECGNNQGIAECGDCLGGYHVDGDVCVVDVACGDNTCNGHGDCTDDTGVPVCACATGYAGDNCEACDDANGWHLNGTGDACTDNPCDPNTCNADDHRVCEAGTGNCLCDTGFCDIDATCIADGTENPDHDCSVCDSATNKNDWSLRGTNFECRASAGECDVAEVCDGVNNDCPVDGFVDDGEVCNDDSNACNGVNTCVSGSCDQTTDPVTCTALDECHAVGTCNTDTGICTNPVGHEGEVCEDDSNACNGVNTCVSGSCDQTTDPVTCTALDECHAVGTCNTDTGICTNPVGHEGEVCEDDSNACNGVNTCVSGSCDQTTDPVTCTALDECHVAGVCDTSTGVCSNPNAVDGAVCETTNQCVSGTCEDCFDATGCSDLAWGDRVDGCSDRVCGAGNSCEFEDETDGTNCGDDDLDQCVTGQCLDCYDATGCSDLAWGDRADGCSDRICADNVCVFEDEPDGTNCGDDDLDQCVTGVCLDCYDALGCDDLELGSRDDECTERICTGGHTCDFNDAVSGSVCQLGGADDNTDQCDASGICLDCTDTGGCGDYTEDDNDCTSLACVDNACVDENDNNNACDLGHDCTDDHCVDGSCLVETVTTGCLIEGVCVEEGVSQDSDGCVACDPTSSKTAWSNMDGATCTDEIGCTNTECSSGDCIVSGTNTGCYIDEACYDEGATEAATGDDSCQVCDSATNWDSWTTKESGGCDDGNACTHTDTCGTGGVCAGASYSCNDHGTCNGDGTCTCENNRMTADCSACQMDYIAFPYCFATVCDEPGVAIPDNDPNGVQPAPTLDFTQGEPTTTACISVEITHTYIGDLIISVVTPEGSVSVLHNEEGGNDDNINEDYSIILPASEDPVGTWTLNVSDNFSQDTGTLDRWCVRPGPCELNVCGNGLFEPDSGEVCNLGETVACSGLGYTDSAQDTSCLADCSGWDETICLCGNGQPDPGEECELGDTVACTSLGSQYTGGTASCNVTCDGWDRSACDWDTPPGFVPITAGSFWMGSPQSSTCPAGYPGVCEDELGNYSDEVLHEVTLTYDFELSRYEITEAEFEGLMGWNAMDTWDSDCTYGCGDDHPMKYISWYDTLAYANQLSLDQGLTPCYVLSNVGCEYGGNVGTDYMECFDGDATYGGIDSATVALNGVSKPQDCEGYRLPTEAEWEYTIRAGTTTAFYNGGITNTTTDSNMDLIGWYYGNNGSSGTPTYGTKPVGGKASNAWGLYDMSGNLWEWTWDKYCSDNTGYGDDPDGSTCTGSNRVARGGNWYSTAQYCRSANRSNNSPGYRNNFIGARLARSSP